MCICYRRSPHADSGDFSSLATDSWALYSYFIAFVCVQPSKDEYMLPEGRVQILVFL